jgi:hypothetical protein
MFSNIFNNITSMKTIEYVIFASIEKKKYFNDEFDNHRFEHEIEWKSIASKISKQNEILERLKQIFMLMINIMFKNASIQTINDKLN